jgi:CheY-like chemotaxis protein
MESCGGLVTRLGGAPPGKPRLTLIISQKTIIVAVNSAKLQGETMANPGYSLGTETRKAAYMVKELRSSKRRMLDLARVLLVDDDPTARLTLQTVLRASGYHVDAAASAAEAVGKLDAAEYELVLTDLHMESPEAGLKVLAHARLMEYKPATALITTYRDSTRPSRDPKRMVLIEPEDLPGLLTKVAELVSERATRRVERGLRHVGT